MSPKNEFSFSCLCRKTQLPSLHFKHQTLPIPIEICHCDTCRHSSGSMAGTFAELNSPPPPAVLSLCTEYKTSAKGYGTADGEDGDGEEPDLWLVWAAGIQRAEGLNGDTVNVSMQIFVDDTRDGGLLGRMVMNSTERRELSGLGRGGEGAVLKTVYAGTWAGETMRAEQVDELVKKGRDVAGMHEGDESVTCQCHCGNVRFCLRRPPLGVQYDEKTQYHLRADNTKYLARICLCRSCSTSTGNPLHAWVYVLTECIVTTDGAPITFGGASGMAQLTGLKKYKTSQNITWTFCGTCGASAFCEDVTRPALINVNPGLVRSESGALAAEWFEWVWDEVSWPEECVTDGLLQSLMEAEIKPDLW